MAFFIVYSKLFICASSLQLIIFFLGIFQGFRLQIFFETDLWLRLSFNTFISQKESFRACFQNKITYHEIVFKTFIFKMKPTQAKVFIFWIWQFTFCFGKLFLPHGYILYWNLMPAFDINPGFFVGRVSTFQSTTYM